jgi:putative membrane protein
MRRASKLFTDEEKKRIEETVREVESKTSAEIVPVAATASGRYDRPEDIVGFWGSVLFLTIAWFWLQPLEGEQGDWGFASPSYGLPFLLLAMLLGFLVGAYVGMQVMVIRHLFTPARQMREEVAARARQIFFDQRVHHTQGASGVLIYLSLYECMAAVIADKAVFDKVGQATLDELCTQLTDAMKRGTAGDALCSVIRSTGERLARVLPQQAQDVNELPNALVILD